MRSSCLTLKEIVYLSFCALIWIAVLCVLPPALSGTDTYLFRDAACNCAAGKGFVTASYERSQSFTPALYSSYTPGTLWMAAAAAKLLGCGRRLGTLFPILWALLLDAIALFAVLRLTQRGWLRRIFIALLGLLLPFGIMNPQADRPEGISLLVLVLLLAILRGPLSWPRIALASLVGGAAFLAQPFAGVLSVVLIAGWVLVSSFPDASGGNRRWSIAVPAFLARSLCCAFLFALPILLTAWQFHRMDAGSLQRFMATVSAASIHRDLSYSMGDAGGASPSGSHAAALGHLEKYKQALTFRFMLGPMAVLESVFVLITVLTWLYLLVTSTGSWRARGALLAAGLACFVLPMAVFPLQGNYLVLTRAFFPLLLAANWAGVRAALSRQIAIPLLLVLNCAAVMPATGLELLQRAESRQSYLSAEEQVKVLAEYLHTHPLNGKQVLAPSTHYYLYKETAENIYNPAYLSNAEDAQAVGAVVNCYASTKNMQPGTLPLPAFVAGRSWQRISTSRGPLRIALFHRPIMSRNWAMDCDLYVPRQ